MELIERSEGAGAVRRHAVKMTFAKQIAMNYEGKAKTGFLENVPLAIDPHWNYASRAINSKHQRDFDSPDVQLLMLSVRRLIGFVNSKPQLRDAFSSKNP